MMNINLFQSLKSHTLILTANQRLAEFVTDQFKHWQQSTDAPLNQISILSFSNWIQSLWQQCNDLQLIPQSTLLTDAQQQAIWEDIIHQSQQGNLLLNASATIRLALEAWSLLNQWQLNWDHPYFAFNEDTRVWQQWTKIYQQRCIDHNLIDNSKMIDYMMPAINSQKISLPKSCVLVGFNELNPQQKKLFNSIKSQQCFISQQQLNTEPTYSARVALADTLTEIRSMARWAKNCFNQNPKAKIACIIPQLSELKNQTQQIFTEIFAPQNLLPIGENKSLPFSISGGQPLSAYPIIHAALQIIALSQRNISISTISSLIRSPYIGGADQEMNARAICDIRLREIGSHNLTLQQIITVASQTTGCQLLAQQLQQFMGLIHHNKQSTVDWHKQFNEQLSALNWPGDVKLNSYEFQLVQQWQELLEQFASLDKFIPHLNDNLALQKLQYLAHQHIYLPELINNPIQIMNVLEASGMVFDHLWVMGLDELSWPTKAQSNSFLPIRLQRELNMPHSSAVQEWQFAQQITAQLLQSAKTVILSHPLQNNDRSLKPSALIKSVTEIDINELALADDFSLSRQIYQSAEFEQFIDDKGPAILADEKIKGGTALIKYQAACPFRAFALYRLNANPMVEAVTGLPAFERGKLIHRILEKFWLATKNHHDLVTLTDDQLTTRIQSIVSATLSDMQKQYAHLFGRRFFHIEHSRLSSLIYRWLSWEKTRKPFTVIATEKRFHFVLGQLKIQMQADRVDQLENDQYAIIDYKTSKISVQDWFGDRLDEPQLPLYCIASIVPINAVAFAQIRTDGINCSTAGETALAQNDRTTKILSAEQWLAQKIQWENALLQISEEFAQGIAIVNPKHGSQTCELCHLSSLCRIHENNS